jgi:hypothetical protein
MAAPAWSSMLQWALWGVIMSAVMGWLGRSRLRGRPARDARTLAHPIGTFILGFIGVAFFAGIAVLSNVYRNSTTTWWTTAIFVAFASLSALMLLEYFVVRHEVSEHGLTYSRLFVWRRRHLQWCDLRAARYVPAMKWFRLESRTGDVVRVSAMLMGLPEFARLLLEHAPPGVIDADSRLVLEATAAGNPPSVWS